MSNNICFTVAWPHPSAKLGRISVNIHIPCQMSARKYCDRFHVSMFDEEDAQKLCFQLVRRIMFMDELGLVRSKGYYGHILFGRSLEGRQNSLHATQNRRIFDHVSLWKRGDRYFVTSDPYNVDIAALEGLSLRFGLSKACAPSISLWNPPATSSVFLARRETISEQELVSFTAALGDICTNAEMMVREQWSFRHV